MPGPADGRGTGGRQGLVRQRQHRVYAHHARPQARGRDLPPPRRRLPRSAGLPPRFFARRAGPAVGLPRRAGHAGQCHRHRRGRRQVDLSLCAGHDQVLLSEQPILNNVPTYQCRKPEDLAYTLANLPELVVKEVHGAGGYGMLVGPASTKSRSKTSASACWHAGRLHRPAHAGAVGLPDLCGKRHRAAPHRSAAVCAVRQEYRHGARRPDPRGAAGRLAGGELFARGRHQGHLGTGTKERLC
jgi:hypothetical protein